MTIIVVDAYSPPVSGKSGELFRKWASNLDVIYVSLGGLPDAVKKHPDHILMPMGQGAFRALFPGKSWEGSFNYVLPFGKTYAIPTIHTKEVFALPENQFWLRSALYKAEQLINNGPPKEPILNVSNNFAQAMTYLDLCEQSKVVSFDIETVSLTDHSLRALGFALSGDSALSVTPDIGPTKWPVIMERTRSLIENPDVTIVGHNVKNFDLFTLWYEQGWTPKCKIWENMNAFKCLYPEFANTLEEQARLRLNVAPWKGAWHTSGEELRRYNALDCAYQYRLYKTHVQDLTDLNMLSFYQDHVQDLENEAFTSQTRGIKFDSALQKEYLEKFKPFLEDLRKEMTELASPYIPTFYKKKKKRSPQKDTLVNITLDPETEALFKKQKPTPKKADIQLFLQNNLKFSKKEAAEIYWAGKADETKFGLTPFKFYKKNYAPVMDPYKPIFNPDSPLQLLGCFRNMGLKLPAVKKSKEEWGESSNMKALKKVLLTYRNLTDIQRKFCELLVVHRKHAQIVKTYLRALIDKDSRYRFSFSVNGAETGRATSSKTPRKTGGNIQNIPRASLFDCSIKNLFLADEGYTFVQFDQSAAEAVIVAYLADCVKLIELIETGTDQHAYTASMALGIDMAQLKLDNPKEFKRVRQSMKYVSHGGNYDMGPKTVVETALKDDFLFTVDEAARLLEARHDIFPEIRNNFHKMIQDELLRTRTLTNPFGRRLRFSGILNEHTFRQGYAFIPQSTVPHLSNLMWRWVTRKSGFDAFVSQQGHDSLLIQVRDSQVEAFIKAFKEEASKIVIPIHHYKVVMKWDCAVGKRWGELHELN